LENLERLIFKVQIARQPLAPVGGIMVFLFQTMMIWLYIGPFLTTIGAITIIALLIRAHIHHSHSIYAVYVVLLVNLLEFLFIYTGNYLTLSQLNQPETFALYKESFVMWSSAFVPWLAWLVLFPDAIEGRGEIGPVKQAAIIGAAIAPMLFYVPAFYDFHRAAKGEMTWDGAGFAQAGMAFLMLFPIMKIGGLLVGAAVGWLYLRYRGRAKQRTHRDHVGADGAQGPN
jgi:hypothetical protein